ncbi:hypothetical protein NDU88_004246 [Pleurodeles waltl]|uniref:Uncharacterized protein n=1 Tax=Pleurodeles waltl TaxID=8319 RepID=A0AAV7NN00_PLEWA|nr:hypothetical protein NDU88_004246 [Pleurodeles waltl]
MGHLRSGTQNAPPHSSSTTGTTTGSLTSTVLTRQPPTVENKWAAVLEVIEKIHTSLDDTRTSPENKIDHVALDLTLLHADHCKLAAKIHTVEQIIVELQPGTREMESSLKMLAERVQTLGTCAEDTEGTEGTDVVAYVERWLRDIIPMSTFSQFFSKERAHVFPRGNLLQALAPDHCSFACSTIMIQPLSYVKPRNSDITVDNASVMFFTDYTVMLQHQRN